MPFKKVDVDELISKRKSADPEFKELWEGSLTEYRLLGNMVKLRKEKGVSQVELAAMTGNKQQVISRIENRENSPTLKTLCGILDMLGYEIQFVPKGSNAQN